MAGNEKRLIDANELLEMVQFRLPIDNKNAEIIAGCVDIARRYIENAPTVDAVEVVRCKDCKKWGGVVYGGRCKYWSAPINGITHFTSADDFCSYGERKDNENP